MNQKQINDYNDYLHKSFLEPFLKNEQKFAWRKALVAPKNKSEFKRMWQNGLLGNKIRSFDTVKEIFDSDYNGPVTIRHKERNSPLCQYYVDQFCLQEIFDDLRKGKSESEFFFNESAPDDKLVMQGEVTRTSSGWHLFCSTEKLPMRKALAGKQAKHYSGAQVLPVLKHYCNSKSYEMLMELFDIYDKNCRGDCVIEFSCYSIKVGEMPYHNTIIWEVRDY